METELIGAACTLAGAVITYVVNPFVTKYVERYFSKKDKSLAQTLDVSAQIDAQLSTLAHRYNVDKVSLLQFHNGGGYYPTGKSIKKFTVFYETIKPGIPSTKLIYQQIPVQLMFRFVEGVLINRYIEFDLSDPAKEYGLSSFGTPYGLKRGYAFGIFNLQDQMLGILSLNSYTSPLTLTDHQIAEVSQQVGLIGGVLMNHLSK